MLLLSFSSSVSLRHSLGTTQLFIILLFAFSLDFFFLCCTLRHFFCRARVCLQTHELLGHLVVGPLRQYPHDGETCFIHGDALDQRVTGAAAAAVSQLTELDDRHADDAILTGKAVVLD